MSLTLSSQAYLRPLLHAARWPHATVLGLLVASGDGSDVTEIVDALPLLHHWTALSPMAEAGLELARAHVGAQSPPRRIVGVYVCNARVDDLSLGRAPLAIARAIAKRLKSSAVALVIDAARLADGEQAYTAYTVSESSTASAQSTRPVTPASPTLPRLALDLIGAGAHKSIEDFDDHLEDVGAPWLDVVVPTSVAAVG